MRKKIQTIILITLETLVAIAALFWLQTLLRGSHHHEINTILPILIDIAFLAFFASLGDRLSGQLGLAPMAGKIIMGIIAGPAIAHVFLPDATGVEIARLAGVLFILFEAGLHFDMELLKKNIGIATLVACIGVGVPLVSFALVGFYILHLSWIASVFLGGIFTATSVGLSVEALKMVGKLNTVMGNRIIGAAVIDDILGVIILSTLSTLADGKFHITDIVWLMLAVVIFLCATYVMWHTGFAHRIVAYTEKHYVDQSSGPYTRLFFGGLIITAAIAAIVGLEPVLGAFGIGVVFSKMDEELKRSVSHKIEGYVHIFVGGFLVSIGTLLTRDALVNISAWGWALAFTVLALGGKYIVKYVFKDRKEGHQVGLAMAIRGEVGLVFVAVAIASGVLDTTMAAASLLAVIMVTVLGAILFERSITKFD